MHWDQFFTRYGLYDHRWKSILRAALSDQEQIDRVRALARFLDQRAGRLLPAEQLVFSALNLTPIDSVRVIILGQDPYPTVGDAHGLAFSVPRQGRLPRSLRNIFAELERTGFAIRTSGNLTDWARQGVLLLNASLTIEDQGRPDALPHHLDQGWEVITAAVLRTVLMRQRPTVLMLWGAKAIAFVHAIALPDAAHSRIFMASHPSPLSVHRTLKGAPAFSGCDHFRQANAWLERDGGQPIAW